MSQSAPTIRTVADPSRWRLVLCVAGVCTYFVLLPGCMVVDVGVTNPVRGLRTVAVAPFFNQSDERAVDGRLLASHYASELQKTPGIEVIPVGVVETTMRRYGLANLSGPRDAAQLAILLNADAVVIGTVAEYSPYYPPRLGLSVAWYSPFEFQFDPGVPVDPRARKRIHDDLAARRKAEFDHRKQRVIEGVESRLDQFFIPRISPVSGWVLPPGPSNATNNPQRERGTGRRPVAAPALSPPIPVVPDAGSADRPVEAERPSAPVPPTAEDARFLPPIIIRSQSPATAEPRRFVRGASGLPAGVIRRISAARSLPAEIRPLMSYTKAFDAADAETAAAFRDYLEWRDDGRPADWTSRLQWADQFSRFVMRTMIVEMFQLHGGEGRRRVVLKFRKYK
ncbi:MAG: hypothetical protein ACE5KM_17860 [Planctomycetaceae bacterium]